jgi:hypothetical protein
MRRGRRQGRWGRQGRRWGGGKTSSYTEGKIYMESRKYTPSFEF